MQYGDIGGPYVPLYPEVVMDLLDEVPSYAARWVYIVLITLFQVDEDWGTDPDWVAGVVNTTKADIMRSSGVGGKGKGGFFNAWRVLLDTALVLEQEDKSLLLPHFKKKRYDSISPREIREKIAGLEKEVEKLREELHESETDRSGPPGDQNLTSGREKESSVRTKESSVRTDQSSERTTDIIIDRKNKKTLSLRDIVDLFYIGIGQEKISGEKRERGVQICRKLIQDGFEKEDIEFAVQWTVENSKLKIYDFSIIQHTIGQATGDRRRKEAQMGEIQEREEEREKKREDEEREKEREEREREEIETYKESLSPDERTRLTKEAQAEITKDGKYKADFVSHILVTAMENTILRRRLEEEKGNGEMTPADSREDGSGE